MKSIVLAIAAAATLAVSTAHAQDTAECGSMLTLAIGQQLDSQGFDTSSICDLTLSDLVALKSLLSQDGMSGAARGQIQKILQKS